MSLSQLVRQRKWSDLEEAWTEWILGEASIEPAVEAVRAAARNKEVPRCLGLVREHADLLVESGRAAEAAELLGEALLLGGSPGELARPLYQAAHAAWGEEPFWATYIAIADLRENVPDMRKSWRAFKKLLGLEAGRVVYHAKGWGLGTIEELDPVAGEVRVRFRSGRSDRFPLQTAVDIFEIVPANDLRHLAASNPDELERMLREEPLEVLRWIVRRNDGRVNHGGIKLSMTTLGVEGARFTGWWKRARRQAETSPWFELSGPATRVQVRILHEAEDPAEGIRRQLARAPLGQALTRVKALLSGGAPEAEVREAALETLETAANDGERVQPQRLAAWLFLRDERGKTPERLLVALQEARDGPPPPDPSRPPAIWALFQTVPGQREQERCIELLREIYGDETWLDESAQHLQHAAPGMVRGLVEALERAGRTQELVVHYTALLARPTRNPTLIVRLAERIETGKHDEVLVPPLRRAQCLLQLSVHLERSASANASLTRARTRLSAVLTEGKAPLLRRLLDGSDVDSLRAFASMIEPGVDRPIDRLFTQIAIETSPDVFRGDERPFWESGIWTSRDGLKRREEELRVLRDVKIPANSEAIGKAASYGDLSENSEWEAAIEEQRNLTQRAMEIEAEVRQAQLLENASLPPDTVAPGTHVRYRVVDEQTDVDIELVGPWDVDQTEGGVSYRSPLGQGMLGRHPGDETSVVLPTGTVRLRILEVRPAQI